MILNLGALTIEIYSNGLIGIWHVTPQSVFFLAFAERVCWIWTRDGKPTIKGML